MLPPKKLNQIAIIKSNSPHQRLDRVVEAESRITPSGKIVMTRQEIEHQLLTLSFVDKAQIVESLTKTLRMYTQYPRLLGEVGDMFWVERSTLA